MSAESDAVSDAARDLTHALSQLVRAIDAVGDDVEAVRHIPDAIPASLEELAGRLSAAQAFKE